MLFSAGFNELKKCLKRLVPLPPDSIIIHGSFNENSYFPKEQAAVSCLNLSHFPTWMETAKVQSWAGFNFKTKMLKKKATEKGISPNFGEVGLCSCSQPGSPSATCWCYRWKQNKGFLSQQQRKRGCGTALFTQTGKRKMYCGGMLKIIVLRRK